MLIEGVTIEGDDCICNHAAICSEIIRMHFDSAEEQNKEIWLEKCREMNLSFMVKVVHVYDTSGSKLLDI